jgi:inner membrane protein
MPSTLVHVAFAGMLAGVLLGPAFDRRTLAVVLAATAVPDLDSFVSLVSTAGHRTVGHTFLIPAVVALAIGYDTWVRGESVLRNRCGWRGVRTAWVSVLAVAVAGIGLDFIGGGVNPLWPIHDQFYRLNGKVVLSNQRGIVQTFVDVDPETGTASPDSFGSSEEVHVSTGVDPNQGSEPENVERIFPIVRSGWQLLLLVVGTSVTAAKLWLVDSDRARRQ